MEFNLIPQVIIIFSIGIIVFVFGKNIPKIKGMQDEDSLFENKNKERRKFLYLFGKLIRKIKKDNYQERTNLVWKWLEKSLRKIRIKFLKLDNKIVSVLEKLKKKSVNYNDKDFEFKKEIESGKNIILEEIEKDKKNDTDESEDELQTSEIINKEKSKSKNEIKKKEEKNSKEKECIDLILKSPKNIKAYWKLGVVYSRKKKYKDSISCFRQIIKIDPGYTKAKKKITSLMKRMKKDKKENE